MIVCAWYCHNIFKNVLYVWFLRLDAVDRRGRKVKQSSSEDLRKYYDLDGKQHLIFLTISLINKIHPLPDR